MHAAAAHDRDKPSPSSPATMPAPVRLRDIDPSLRSSALLGSIRHVHNPAVRGAVRWALRHWPRPSTPGIRVRVTRTGDAGLRIYEPDGKHLRPALLWIHGGGLVVGSARQDDGICARTAAALDAVVVSVDYRLAPEHPFPAAIDDATAGWEWLLDHAGDLGVDTTRLAIGGESAGGGLAAALVQRLHDQGGTQPIAQWLFAPMLDDRTAGDTQRDAQNHFVWNNRANRYGWTAYLGAAAGASSVPDYAAAARRDDLSGLPATWIYTTDIELFADEITEYARQLTAAGVRTDLVTVSGAAHAFELFEGTPLARELVGSARSWLGERFGEDARPSLRTP